MKLAPEMPKNAEDIPMYPNVHCHGNGNVSDVSGSQRTSFPPSLTTEGRTGTPGSFSASRSGQLHRAGAPVLRHEHFGGLFAKPGCFGREVDTRVD